MQKLITTVALSLTLTVLPVVALAQGNAGGTQTPPPPSAPAKPADPLVSLDLRDAPLRSALEQLFTQVKVDFSIDPGVRGYVNLKVTDQPFETVLRLLLRASSQPVTYVKDSGIYIVKPRLLTTGAAPSAPPSAEAEGTRFAVAGVSSQWEVISLMYLDPADLAGLLNVINVPSGSRHGGTPGSGGGIGGNPGTGGSFGTGSGIGGIGGGSIGLIGLPGGAGPGGGPGSGVIVAPGGGGQSGGSGRR